MNWPSARSPSSSSSESNTDDTLIGQCSSISGRLRISFLVSSTLPLLLVGILLITLNYQNQQRYVYASQEDLAEQTAQSISAFMLGVETQLLGFGQNFRPQTPILQLEAAADNFIVSNPNIQALTVFDNGGAQIVQVVAGNRNLDRLSNQQDISISLAAALQNGIGQRGNVRQLTDGQLLLTIILPVRLENGTIIGAISADINAAQIAQELRAASDYPNVAAYLVDVGQEVLIDAEIRGWRPPERLDAVFQTEDITTYQNGDGNEVIGVRARVQANGWWVVVEQLNSAAFGNVYRSVILLGGLVALVGLLALAWGLYQAQQLLRPLRQLRVGALELGRGSLEHRIEIRGDDEMAQVAHTFNQMAARLQSSLSAIEDQNERLREGLLLARDIQMGLLPDQTPWSHRSLTVYARSIPAFEVGGDFYTYATLPSGQSAIAVGDISGKGVGAALIMALTSSMVESQARHNERPAEMLASLNRLLWPRLRANRMNAALLIVVFDHATDTMTVSNAGMIAPLLICARRQDRKSSSPALDGEASAARTDQERCSFLEVGGLPVGSLPGAVYNDVNVVFEPGDILLLLSDGVVEAHNADGELFGFERLEQLIANHPEVDVHLLVDVILKHVQDFIGPAEQHDDITIVAVRPDFAGRDPEHDMHYASASPQQESTNFAR